MENSQSSLTALVENIIIDSSSETEDAPGKLSPKKSKSNRVFPPCRICGDKSSGFHFGANTCEACKKFFRLSLIRNSEYKCAKERKCVINLTSRAACSFCRLQKCFMVGMSKDASKTGRHTLTKKNQDIREVKHLEKSLRKAAYQHKPWGVTSEDRLRAVILRLTSAHRKETPFTPELFATIPEKEKQYLELKRLKNQVYGSMHALSHEEFMNIFKSTGLDVDGRMQMMNSGMNFLESSLKNYVAMMKRIPGFNQLDVPDQIALVKATRTDIWIFWYYPTMNLDLGLWMLPWGDFIELEDLKTMSPATELFDLKHKLVRRLQNMKLTYEENVLLGCVAFMSSDGVDLKNPKLVEDSQLELVEALHFLLLQSHQQNHGAVLAMCLSLLTELHSVAYLHDQDLKFWQKELASSAIKVPPLIGEIWNS